MKIDRITPFLIGILLCLAICASGLSVWHNYSLSQLHKLQGQYLRMNSTIKTVQLLFAQCRQYSKTNPDIIPILQQFESKPATNTLPDLPLLDTPSIP